VLRLTFDKLGCISTIKISELRIAILIFAILVLSSIYTNVWCKRQINDNLEAMAKQLYDYWFVQFDFPNEEGNPYKSSGGAMVWNEDLHMRIPCNWKACLLSDYIGCNNTGDWGFDEPAEKRSIKVGCIRGADIVKLNNLPIRYIKDNNTSKLLSAWDIVIEVSGGSPTQATGRSAFVTPGVLKRNGGNLTCSNFCHAFTMKDCKASAYFYFMWRMFYDNNNMFNFEGKTSGIKNFMTDTFLANKWLDVPTVLLDLFFERVKVIFEQIDNNIEEINALTKQRDELLPLLMNGQASVNYHLSAC
jgi:type I restriction enzyme S subunit